MSSDDRRDAKGRFSTSEDKQLNRVNEELLGLYLHSLKEQKTGTSESTINTRRREVRYWLAFCQSNEIEPLAPETSDVRAYIQSISSDLADTTIESYYRSVQSFYSIVQNDQLYDELTLENGHPCPDKHAINLKEDYRIYGNVSEYRKQLSVSASEIEGTREKSSEILAIEPEKIKQMFDHVPGKTKQTRLRNEVAVRLNWYTGCRSDELERLKIGNIDWDRCSIEVRSAKLDPSEHPDMIHRDVFFPEEFKLEFRRWVERVRHAFSSAVEPNSGRVLCTTHSDHMDSSLINDIVKGSAENAGIQRPLRPPNPDPDEEVYEWLVTTHRIRRSAISHWVNDVESIDLHQARRMAGHARIQQTMDYVEDDDIQLAEDYQRGMSA